jgi:hypothetical protein
VLQSRYPDETVLGISVFSGEGLGELAACLGRLALEGDREAEEAGVFEEQEGEYREA